MKTRYCPINHHDTRGIIRDIFGSGAPDCVTLITQRAGSVRGNHLHKLSTQHLFVVSGGIIAYTRPPIGGMVERIGLGAGAMISHVADEAHAYEAYADSVLLAFAEGVRKGTEYEQDTYRIPDLIDEFMEQNGGALKVQASPIVIVGEPW